MRTMHFWSTSLRKRCISAPLQGVNISISHPKRKARTHHFCEIAGTLYKVLGREFEDGDVERLENFLNGQEQWGDYFSKAMNARPETEVNTNESANK